MAATGESDLGKIAEMADRVVEAQESGVNQVSAVDNVKVIRDSADSQVNIDRLTSLIEKLTKDVANIKSELGRTRSKSRDRARASLRSKSPQRIPDSNNASLCRWHRKFGDKARMCRQPCSFWIGDTQSVTDKSAN